MQVLCGAGTEEGAVHLCSINMPNHYVESFFGHAGPVYHVAWSPASSETFASASADGTACLWRLHQVQALSIQHLCMMLHYLDSRGSPRRLPVYQLMSHLQALAWAAVTYKMHTCSPSA